jgi:hypothetical protein
MMNYVAGPSIGSSRHSRAATSRTGSVRVADHAARAAVPAPRHQGGTGQGGPHTPGFDQNGDAEGAGNILAKLDLPPSADSNRRALAVLTWLRRHD